jgi:AcrR family transcriptional regulator
MDSRGIRAELITSARAMLVNDFDHFSLAAVCKETGISRSKVRKLFAKKADLINAVFSETQSVQREREHLNKAPRVDDWIERRFRVCERALSLLEERTTTATLEQSRTLSFLEKRFANPGIPPLVTEPSQLLPQLCDQPGPVPPPVIAEVDNAGRTTFHIDPTGSSVIVEGNHFPGISAVVSEPNGSIGIELPLQDPEALSAVGRLDARETMKKIFENAQLTTSDHQQPEPKIAIKLTPEIVLAMVSVSIFVIVSIISLVERPRATHTATVLASVKPHRVSEVLTIDATGQLIAAGHKSNAMPIPEVSAMAEKGDTRAQTALAFDLLRGNGVNADPLSAGRWSQIAASKGEPTAQYILGTLYAQGIQPNPRLAVQWYSAAAAQGNVKAMHNLAIAFLTGLGVDQDAQKAASWFTKAANKGYRDSAFDLGILYERGQGVAQDREEALKWYDNAAALGDQQASTRAAVLRAKSL